MTKEEEKEYKKKWYLAHREEVKLRAKKYKQDNKEHIKECSRKYRKENSEKIKEWRKNNVEHVKQWRKKYKQANKEKIAKYEREKRRTDPLYKLKANIRRTICDSLKQKGYLKDSQTIKIIGCTFDELKKYLESKFEYWMTWENKGLYNGNPNYGWDIDHIIPLSEAKSKDDIIRLNHYTNLQPLCSYINRDVKKNKITSNHF